MKITISFLLIVCGILSIKANVSLPKIFTDHMVLQRNQAIPVWGWAERGEKVTVILEKQRKETVTGIDGKWRVDLSAIEAGGPFNLIVMGRNKLIVSDVLIGEVWLCSGQSNMEMPIAGWGKVNNYEVEIAKADFPQIRQFNVEKTTSSLPRDRLDTGSWVLCGPSTAGDFIATGYFFAREVNKQLHVPVGIINSSWGGSMIETWVSRQAFAGDPEFEEMISNLPAESIAASTKQKIQRLENALERLKAHSEYTNQPYQWNSTSLNDHEWPEITLPGYWEKQDTGLADLDGILWFRKTIQVNDTNAGRAAMLSMGLVDDIEKIYINGTELSLTNTAIKKRIYGVCPGILKSGNNVLAMRIEDKGGYGGVFGKPEDMFLQIGNVVTAIDGIWKFRVEKVNNNVNPNNYPTLLYNSMIHPLIPFAIKGVLWYQGETNAGRAYQYRKAFPLLIKDFRSKWKQGDFPFYFVQLSAFDWSAGSSEKGSTWAELREAQAMTLKLLNTGMAVTIDIGDAKDIHPKNKQDVGRRLALLALNNTYDTTLEDTGPMYESIHIQKDKIVITFNHARGLNVKDKYGYVHGVEVAGKDRQFYYAKGYIKNEKLVVWTEQVKHPVAVRYAWADDPSEANIFNGAGLPAAPFRTDKWPGITDNVKFQVLQ